MCLLCVVGLQVAGWHAFDTADLKTLDGRGLANNTRVHHDFKCDTCGLNPILGTM